MLRPSYKPVVCRLFTHPFRFATPSLALELSCAVWLLGNLARATYVGSSDFMWPFSYNVCDTKGRLSQEINACDKVNHYGMSGEFGRGSPEIDILESMQGNMDEKLPNTHIKRPYQSTSLQVRYPCIASVVTR